MTSVSADMLQMTNKTWNLLLIATHSDHQKKGCGKELIKNVEELLSQRQQRVLIVETSGLQNLKARGPFTRTEVSR